MQDFLSSTTKHSCPHSVVPFPCALKIPITRKLPAHLIVKERNYSAQPVIGIAADSGFSTLFVDKYLMNQEIGFGRRLLQILEEEEIPFEHTPSGIDNLSVIIRSKFSMQIKKRALSSRVKEELNADDVHMHSRLLHDCSRRRRNAPYNRTCCTCSFCHRTHRCQHPND